MDIIRDMKNLKGFNRHVYKEYLSRVVISVKWKFSHRGFQVYSYPTSQERHSVVADHLLKHLFKLLY